MNIFKFVDGTFPDLYRRPFLEMDYSTVRFLYHHQYASHSICTLNRQKAVRVTLDSSVTNSQCSRNTCETRWQKMGLASFELGAPWLEFPRMSNGHTANIPTQAMKVYGGYDHDFSLVLMVKPGLLGRNI
jgi:hypothetical protein